MMLAMRRWTTWQLSAHLHPYTCLIGVLSTEQEPGMRVTSLYLGPLRVTVTRYA